MKLLFAVNFLLFSLHAFPQKGNNYIETRPYFKYDKYPTFIYAINPVTTNTVKIQGRSFGVSGAYGHGLAKNLKAKIGVGYYRYSFNNIYSFNSSYGVGNSRVIVYPDGGDMIYSTNKYWYHSFCISGGLEKYIFVTKQIDLLIGGHLQYYRTFSQYYKIFDTKSYSVHNRRGMGFGGTIQLGFTYKISRFVVVPQLLIPLYDQWRQDAIFPGEKNNDTRDKWFKGYGVGLGLQYELFKESNTTGSRDM